MKTCVLVATHKQFDDTELEKNGGDGYSVICVGDIASEADLKDNYLRDNDGEDNISALNGYYCELTALYWAWKNLMKTIDYIGLSHYRRYFCTYHTKSTNIYEQIITKEEIEKILNDYDVILPYPGIKERGMFLPSRDKDLKEQDIYMYVVDKILRTEYPDFVNAWERNIYGKVYIAKNMFITKRDIYNKYCKFIFDVLKKFDDYMEKTGQVKIARIDGFLAEYLTPTFFLTTIDTKKIKYCDVRNAEKNCHNSLKELLRRNRIIYPILRSVIANIR